MDAAGLTWTVVYYIVLVVWYTVLAVFYAFRKCIFLVSFLQLCQHLTIFQQFVVRSTPENINRVTKKHKKIKGAHPQSTDSATLEKRSKKQHKLIRRDILLERKVSTTLLDLRHKNNYESTRDYWSVIASSDTESPRRSTPKRDSDSEQSRPFQEVMGNSVDYAANQAISSQKSSHKHLQRSLQHNHVAHHSDKSSDSYVVISDSEESDDLSDSDEEFIRAFKDSDGDEDSKETDEIEVSVHSIHSDCVDSTGVGQDFIKIVESCDFAEILEDFSNLIEKIGIYPGTINDFFPSFKEFITRESPLRFNDLLDKLEARKNASEYMGGTVARGKKVLIIGGGPCGLRLAIECQMLGAETTVMEARTDIDRNNILKLWSFVMEDLKNMGAKKLCPSLGIGCLNHMSIKTLQFVLLKICLILGVRIKPRQCFKSILEPSISTSWPVLSDILCENGDIVEEEEEFDAVIGATGRRVTLDGFKRQSLDAKMAIAITANFRNFNTLEERHVQEIPGLSKQYDQEFFNLLEKEKGIKLENIVYYQGNTHYFVMTAKKQSLLNKGVLKQDLGERVELLRPENIDRNMLEAYAREAAEFSTSHFSHKLPFNPFAKWKGGNDVSIFDFTNLYRSQNACRIIQRNNCTLLTGLVGDSLLEPFWPEGTGIGQGFLSVLDTAWMVKRYFQNGKIYEIIREREKLYCLLRQTAQSGLKKNYDRWSIDPRSRYNTTTFHFNQNKIYQLFDTDQPSSGEDIVDNRQGWNKGYDEVRLRKKYRRKDMDVTRETMFFAD